jgi:hypothetical protein
VSIGWWIFLLCWCAFAATRANSGAQPNGFKAIQADMASVRWKLVGSKAEIRQQLLERAAIPVLKRTLVSHGAIIDDNSGDVLRNLRIRLPKLNFRTDRAIGLP